MSERRLHIAPGVSLPADAITQTFGVLAVRGAGKSNLAAVIAEEMADAGLPFVVVDPVGSWYGLRSSGTGNGPGLPIPIFGGRHGDVPLERTGGQMVADLIVEHRLSCVLDVSELSEGDKIRFLIDFAERLYRKNTDPLHLFLEEADDYIPQRPFREQARLLRAFENIVRRGRARGLGMTMISQRSAAVNKSVLTQIETLFVLRTTSPQDRKAIEAWVEYHGQAKELLESLSSLGDGEAWVWSPHWLKRCERARIRRRRTFDSGATPKDVHGRRPAATMADINLDKIRAGMAETIERHKAEDPRELRRRVADLERQLAARPPVPVAEVATVEVPVLAEDLVARLEAAVRQATDVANHHLDAARARWEDATQAQQAIHGTAKEIIAALAAARRSSGNARPAVAGGALMPTAVAGAGRPVVLSRPAPAVSRSNGNGLGGSERKILTALAQYHAGRTKVQVALLTGYRHTGGRFNNLLGALRSSGYLKGDGSRLELTPAGREALGDFDALPVGQALLEHWYAHLPPSEAKVLRVAAESWPQPLSRHDIAAAAGYDAGGGRFNNILGRLRAFELLQGRGEIRASDDLFGTGP